MDLGFHGTQDIKRCVLRGGGQGVRIFIHPQKSMFSLGISEAGASHPHTCWGLLFNSHAHLARDQSWGRGVRTPQTAGPTTGARVVCVWLK